MFRQSNILLVTLFSLIFPIFSFATWQLANPIHHTQTVRSINPEFGKTDHPGLYYNLNKYTMYIRHGLLKDNIERFAEHCHWKVRWLAEDNYYVLVNSEITGSSFSKTLNRLLKHYPLKAKYNYKTCSVTVFPPKYYKYSK